MRLLMAQRAHERLHREISEILPDCEIAVLAEGGRAEIAGRQADFGDMRPDVVWISVDAARAGVVSTLLGIALEQKARWVQTFNAGLDNPLYAKIIDAGIRLCNSDAQANAISQFILAEVLSEWSRLPELRTQQTECLWKPLPFREIDGSNWLIVGYGAIGKQTARRARAFGARVVGLRRTPAPDQDADLVASSGELFLHLPQADVVVIAAALTEETRGLVDERFLRTMKPGSVIVNVARGAIIRERDLVAALDAGTPGLAILDVFVQEPLPPDHALWLHPNVRISPHNSNNGERTPWRGDQLFLTNLRRFSRDEPLTNEVRAI